MAGKTLKGTTVEEWRSHKVSFIYKGKAYNEPVTNRLYLPDLSVTEIKDRLNEIPGRLSYWKSLQVRVEREIFDMEEDFEQWYQRAYMDVDAENKSRTENWKKSKVMLDNAEEYRIRRAALRDMKDVNSDLSVLVTGYNTMTWTLREIARLTHAEMSNIELRGRGSLADRK